MKILLLHSREIQFYYITVAYHVGLNAVLRWPPGPANV